MHSQIGKWMKTDISRLIFLTYLKQQGALHAARKKSLLQNGQLHRFTQVVLIP
jgi:hypothetical protein